MLFISVEDWYYHFEVVIIDSISLLNSNLSYRISF